MRSPSAAVVVGLCLLLASSACGGRTADLGSSGSSGGATGPTPAPGGSSPTDPPTSGGGTTPTSPQLGPRPDDRDGRYAWLKKAIVGSWLGTRSTPWDGTVDVAVTFDAGGTYHSRCQSGNACQVWYYGIDDDVPGRTYELEDVGTNLKGSGSLAVPFSKQGGDVQTGSIERVEIDETGSALTFDFYATWGGGRYGPVHFDLKRTSP